MASRAESVSVKLPVRRYYAWCEQTRIMPAKNGIKQPGGHLSRWWRNSRYFQLGQGYPFAKGESGIVHDTFWKAKAFATRHSSVVRSKLMRLLTSPHERE